MIANPWLILAAVLSLIGSLGGGYWWGTHAQANADKAEKLASVTRAIEQANQVAVQDAEILAAADIKRANRRAIAQKLDEEIEKNVAANPAYSQCGLDADGLRLWNAANAGIEPDLPGQRGYGLPPAALRQVGRQRSAPEKPQASDGPLPRMPGFLPQGLGARQ